MSREKDTTERQTDGRNGQTVRQRGQVNAKDETGMTDT